MGSGAFSRQLIVILLAAAALYLVGNASVGLFDRDEPRYAQASRQMLSSDPSNWVVPMLLDQPRTAKPIFIYWCQAAAMAVFGPTPFAARLPSALAMLLTLALLGVTIGRLVGEQRALWTVFILSTSGLAIAVSKLCITDSVLLLWIVLAEVCLFALYRGSGSRAVAAMMWVAIALAGLTKGPVVLGVLGMSMLTLAALDVGGEWRSGAAWRQTAGWWRRTRPVMGLLIVAAIVGPWLWMLELRSPGFLRTTLSHDVMERTVRPIEGHSGPPGFYLLTVWATYLPWSLLLPAAALAAWKNRRLRPIRFAMAAVVGPWLLMEAVQTKLVHYVLPAFPAMAFLTADALVRSVRGRHHLLPRPVFMGMAAVWAVAVAAIGFAPWLAVRYFTPLPWMLYPAMVSISLAALACAAVVFGLFLARRVTLAAAAMGGGMMAVVTILYGLYLPNAEFLWVPERVAQVLQREGATRLGDVVMVGYVEDSLPFYQGGTIRMRPSDYLHIEPPHLWAKWIVLPRSAWEQAPDEAAAQFELIEAVRGWGYADGGRPIEVLVIRKRETLAGGGGSG